jgi:hypothetical protein
LLDRAKPQKCEEASVLAKQKGFRRLIWQDPDHEALLLRHLPKCQDKRPASGDSMRALQKQWPDYVKGMSAQQLARQIALPEILSASAVEVELRSFLIDLGFNFN